MKRDYDKIISMALVALIVPYGAFNIIRYLNNPYTTMVAYSHYENETYDLKGVVLRDELVMDQGISDNCYYSREDAELVALDQEILRVYASETDIEYLSELEELNREIAALKEASTLENQYLATEQLKVHINKQVAELYRTSVTGNLSTLTETREQLTSLVNKRMVATGRESGFSARIAMLEQRRNQLSASIGTPISQIKAPQIGYFASTADGYESSLSAKGRNALDFNSLYQMIESTGASIPKPVTARLVTHHNWYLALAVPENILDSFTINREVTMDFGNAVSGKIKGVISDIRSEGNRHIVMIKCGMITPDILRLRKADVNITFRGYEGLMINKEALRYNENNEAGVYIVQGGVIQFRRVEVVYQNDSYMLCKENSELPNSLSLFDEVIIKGKDAYHGKVLSKW